MLYLSWINQVTTVTAEKTSIIFSERSYIVIKLDFLPVGSVLDTRVRVIVICPEVADIAKRDFNLFIIGFIRKGTPPSMWLGFPFEYG